MDLGRPTTTAESRELIGMVEYYREICPRRSHVLYPLTDAAIIPKGRKILWNGALECFLKEIKRMVSADTLLSYPYWTIPLTVNTDTSDK